MAIAKKFDRSAMQAQLKARHADSAATKNAGALDFETYYTVPSGVGLWMPDKSKDGKTSYFDIIPFMVETDNMPWIKTEGGEWKQLKAGEWTYLLDVWIHKKIGHDNATVICLDKSFRGKCPVCEHMADLLEQAKDDKDKRKKIFSEKAPQRRIMYNVIVRDDGEQERKGVQILEFSYNWMERELQKKAEKTRSRGPIYYPDPELGKTIKILIVDKGDNKWDVTVDFDDRPATKPVTDEDMEKAIPLDTLIKVLDYDTFSKVYWQEKDEEPAKGSSGVATGSQETKAEEQKAEAQEPLQAEPGKCPFEEAVFGKDHMSFQECETCSNEPDCGKTKERMIAEEKARKEAEEKASQPAEKKGPTRRPNRLVR